jgi:hypothetical protein
MLSAGCQYDMPNFAYQIHLSVYFINSSKSDSLTDHEKGMVHMLWHVTAYSIPNMSLPSQLYIIYCLWRGILCAVF